MAAWRSLRSSMTETDATVCAAKAACHFYDGLAFPARNSDILNSAFLEGVMYSFTGAGIWKIRCASSMLRLSYATPTGNSSEIPNLRVDEVFFGDYGVLAVDMVPDLVDVDVTVVEGLAEVCFLLLFRSPNLTASHHRSPHTGICDSNSQFR